jgi:hypothetical protein
MRFPLYSQLGDIFRTVGMNKSVAWMATIPMLIIQKCVPSVAIHASHSNAWLMATHKYIDDFWLKKPCARV